MKMNIRLVSNMRSSPIITCPACGYSFKNENLGAKNKKLICPMCRYQFKDPNFPSERLDEFTI